MKTHIIILAEKFPKGHPKAGNPTRFGGNLTQGIKIHTIRDNWENWQKKVDEVKDGTAVISIRVWSGTPYRSKQIELRHLDASSGVGIQKLHSFDKDNAFFIGEDGNVFPVPLQELANNDGLSVNDWHGWFENNPEFPLVIIHFTDFRYKL